MNSTAEGLPSDVTPSKIFMDSQHSVNWDCNRAEIQLQPNTMHWLLNGWFTRASRRRSVRSCSRTVLLIPEKWLYGMLTDNIDPDRRTVIRGHHVEASISIHLKQDHATNGEEMRFSLIRFKERCVVSLTQKKHRCAVERLETGRALNVHVIHSPVVHFWQSTSTSRLHPRYSLPVWKI